MTDERNSDFLKNGALLLEKIIASTNGRCNPIRNFSAKQLEQATDNYDPCCVFGENGLGKWYKGSLEGRVVSICKPCEYRNTDKIVNDRNEIVNNFDAIVNDIAIAAQLSAHKNVLRLIGCCLESPTPILVYECAENGNLRDLLEGVNGNQSQNLPWESRLKTAKEIAYALSYLHTAFPRPIVHRDIHPSNIFLDEDNVAKLSNFSKSISIPEDKTLRRSTCCARIGYFPPEFEITEKVDVYCFGTLLLELLIGGQLWSVLFYEHTFHNLNQLQYYVSCHCHSVDEVIDNRILAEGGGLNEQCQWQAVADLAFMCLETIKEKRPTMVEVTKQLTQIQRSSTMVMARDQRPFFMKEHTLLEEAIGSSDVIHMFSAKELKLATNNYDLNCIFSCCNLGIWYKGSLEGREISICKISSLNQPEHLNYELKSSMEFSGHNNVLKLLGCCLADQVLTLVYESAASGTLYHQIEVSCGPHPQEMLWNNRLTIGRQIADGAAYLYAALSRPIIYGDLTLSNIFLNEDYVPKLSNSHSIWICEGEAEEINDILPHGFSDIADFSKACEKMDVYNFGLLLLQLLLARKHLNDLRPCDGRSSDLESWMNNVGGDILVNYIKYYLKCHCFDEVVDPRILADGQGLYLQQQWQDVVELVCRCLEIIEDKRPMMIEVATKLEQIERALATVNERDGPMPEEQRIFIKELTSLYKGKLNPLRSFSAEELKKATDCYDCNCIFSYSNLGIWYLGHLVKGKFSICKINGTNWLERVNNEIRIAAQLGARKNVLKLLGYCIETPVPALVYEPAENGTLRSHLHCPNNKSPLSLKSRLKIAKKIAHEVAHLHTAFSPPIIHGNLKSENIFLDKHYVPTISSFSQFKLVREEGTITKGYMPPEFMNDDAVTEKYDIYSFGVLLIELLIGGWKLTDMFYEAEEEGSLLQDQLRNYLSSHSLDDIVDYKIKAENGEHQEHQKWEAVIELAFKCMVTEKERRPTMVEIEKELKRI